jgi:hypothetical protein
MTLHNPARTVSGPEVLTCSACGTKAASWFMAGTSRPEACPRCVGLLTPSETAINPERTP